MSSPDRVRLFLYDYQGRRSTMLFNVLPALSGMSLGLGISLLEALTDCAVNEIRRETVLYGPAFAAGGTGPYSSARDVVSVNLTRSGLSGVIPISLTGPKAGIFLPDTYTIDKNQADVSAAVTWLLANAVDDSGGALAQLLSGNRWYFNKP